MLTPRQAELLAFIERYQDKHSGGSPSFDEMREGINLAAKSGVHRLICELQERGFIHHSPYLARNITVLRRLETTWPINAPNFVLQARGWLEVNGYQMTIMRVSTKSTGQAA